MAKCLYFRQTMASNSSDGPGSDPMNHMETNHASLLSLEPGQLAMLGTETLFPDLDVSASCPSAMFDPDILMHDLDHGSSRAEVKNETGVALSDIATPTNASPITTPTLGSSPINMDIPEMGTTSSVSSHIPIPSSSQDAHNNSEVSSNCSSLGDSTSSWSRMEPLRPFRTLPAGLDTIPENEVSANPITFQPLVPPPVAKPATTSYNISFPTTLQPRHDNNLWMRPSLAHLVGGTSTGASCSSPGGASTSFPASPASHSSLQSPFHGALAKDPLDANDFQPLNVIESDSSVSSVQMGRGHRTKRSRRNTPVHHRLAQDEEMDEQGGSRRRRKSNPSSIVAGTSSSESKRRDIIKFGLDELQRVLPHIGKPGDEKKSQASVLLEGGKYIKLLQGEHQRVRQDHEGVNKQIDELNNQIEHLQNQLPANGAPLLPKVMAAKTLPDQFHDHVVAKTKDDWRYWVFVSIMGHFVHTFEEQVSAATLEDLETTSSEYVANFMTLQQLRKDAYRKLAKLCAKTSIVENPSKLPEEALGFVTRGERAFKTEKEMPPDS